MVEEVKPTDDMTPTDYEEEVETKDIKRLEDLKGVGPKTANKLRDLGYSVVGLATARADEVSAEMKVSFNIAKGWIMEAQEAVLSKMVLKTANQVTKERKEKIQYIQTGSSDFNKLIGGGIATGATTGISGRFSTGKTQIIFEAIVDCVCRLKRKAVYIETEPNTFHSCRLEEIAKGKGYTINLDDVIVCEAEQIPTAKAQYLQYKIIQKALENGENIGLVCVDSFTAKFRPGYSRREMLPVRTREFTEHFLLIDYIASKYNVAWILSCQVIGCPDPGATLAIKMKTGDSFYPIGGEYLLHSVTTWISLQQIKTELYEAIIFDSSYLPRGKCNFSITEGGIRNEVK